jgi:hypothetical protein
VPNNLRDEPPWLGSRREVKLALLRLEDDEPHPHALTCPVFAVVGSGAEAERRGGRGMRIPAASQRGYQLQQPSPEGTSQPEPGGSLPKSRGGGVYMYIFGSPLLMAGQCVKYR